MTSNFSITIKADLYGHQFITISPRNTTQTCHDCGFVMGTDNTKKLTLADREWKGTRVITLVNFDQICDLVAKYQYYVEAVTTYKLGSFYTDNN